MKVDSVQELNSLVGKKVYIDIGYEKTTVMAFEVDSLIIKPMSIRKVGDGPVCPHVVLKRSGIMGPVPISNVWLSYDEVVAYADEYRRQD
jgi:hypothetical protein